MDFFDERILTVLGDGKSRTFSLLLSLVGFSHNTLQKHLCFLAANGFVIKEKDPKKGFGRPRFVYRATTSAPKRAPPAQDPASDLVLIPFSKLKHACRFEKGGFCKEKRKSCSAQICPQIKK